MFYPTSAYGIDPIQPMEEIVISTPHETINGSVLEENEEDNQYIPAPPRKMPAGSSKKSKKHKRRTRRRTRRRHQK